MPKDTKTEAAPAKAPAAGKAAKGEPEPASKEFVKKAPKVVVEEKEGAASKAPKVEKKFLKNGKEDLSFLDKSLPQKGKNGKLVKI